MESTFEIRITNLEVVRCFVAPFFKCSLLEACLYVDRTVLQDRDLLAAMQEELRDRVLPGILAASAS